MKSLLCAVLDLNEPATALTLVFSPMTMTPIRCISILACHALACGVIGCTTLGGGGEPQAISPCANNDWYEIGRTDGLAGVGADKLRTYQQRCDGTKAPVQVDLYQNGREAGLIDFCTPTGGLEAGRNGLAYDKVCPEHLEPVFLQNYTLGTRIRQLESEHDDLQSRIDNLNDLIAPSQSGGSIRAQIEQLRTRRAQIDTQISSLEDQADESDEL